MMAQTRAGSPKALPTYLKCMVGGTQESIAQFVPWFFFFFTSTIKFVVYRIVNMCKSIPNGLSSSLIVGCCCLLS